MMVACGLFFGRESESLWVALWFMLLTGKWNCGLDF